MKDSPQSQPQPLWGDLLDFVYHLSHIKRRASVNWLAAEPGFHITGDIRQVEVFPKGIESTHSATGHFDTHGLLPGALTDALTTAAIFGEPFAWSAIFRQLIAPIRGHIGGEQGQFMMYSVVEFSAQGADFSVDSSYEGALVSMSELEEGSHTPQSPAQAARRVEKLSNRHIAATPMGVAHFVSRQSDEDRHTGQPGYEGERAARLMVNFFASILAAYFQWIGLRHYERLAARCLAPLGSLDRLKLLAREFTWFSASANLTQINRRDSHNRYYERLRISFRTESAMVAMQRTLRDIGRSIEIDQESAQLALSRQTQSAILDSQKALHHAEQRQGNLELFIVLVYVVELAHIFGGMAHAKHGYSTIAALIGMAVALLLVLLIAKKRPEAIYSRWIKSTDEKIQKRRESNLIQLALWCLFLYVGALMLPWLLESLRQQPVPAEHVAVEMPKVVLPPQQQSAPH